MKSSYFRSEENEPLLNPPGYSVVEDEEKHEGKNFARESKVKIQREIGEWGLRTHRAQVAFVLDISNSMEFLIDAGVMDRVIHEAGEIASLFDDNSELEVFYFGDNVSPYVDKIKTKENEHYNFSVRKAIDKYYPGDRNPLRLGTNYHYAIDKIIDYYFENKKPVKTPEGQGVFVIFLTDGNCDDSSLSRQSIIKASKYGGLFFKFIGIGERQYFKTLESFDDLSVASCPRFYQPASKRVVDNADFIACPIDKISKERTIIQDDFFREYTGFLKESYKLGLIAAHGLTDDALQKSVEMDDRKTGCCFIL